MDVDRPSVESRLHGYVWYTWKYAYIRFHLGHMDMRTCLHVYRTDGHIAMYRTSIYVSMEAYRTCVDTVTSFSLSLYISIYVYDIYLYMYIYTRSNIFIVL
jgi:hypothetical protein